MLAVSLCSSGSYLSLVDSAVLGLWQRWTSQKKHEEDRSSCFNLHILTREKKIQMPINPCREMLVVAIFITIQKLKTTQMSVDKIVNLTCMAN